MTLLGTLGKLVGFRSLGLGSSDGDDKHSHGGNETADPPLQKFDGNGDDGGHSAGGQKQAIDQDQHHGYETYIGDDHGYFYSGEHEGGSWASDGASDLHGGLASMPDTGAMLDAAISHLDSSAAPLDADTAGLDLPHFDDVQDGHTGIS